jgi:predicted transcriptional regulator
MTSQQRQKHYRGHWEIIRVCLRFLKDSAEPMPSYKILYTLQCSVESIGNLISEMEYLGLIKVYTKEYENSRRMSYTITQKGTKVLELLDKQAKLLSKSPWIDENIHHNNR